MSIEHRPVNAAEAVIQSDAAKLATPLRPLIITLAIYLGDALLWLPLMFFVAYPAIFALLPAHTSHSTLVIWESVLNLAADVLGEGALPLALAIVVVWRGGLLPFFPGRQANRALLAALILLTLLFAVTLDWRTALSTVGILTGIQYLFVGVCEEWSFRGVILRVLRGKMGLIAAMLISSALFALWHWLALVVNAGAVVGSASWWASMAEYFVLGLLFALIAWLSRSILWAAVIHGVFDWGPWGSHALLTGALPSILVLVIGLLGAMVIWLTTRQRHRRPALA